MSSFSTKKTIEKQFEVQLKKIARSVGTIVEMYTSGVYILNKDKMDRALRDYSDALEPWALTTTSRILKSVDFSNQRAFLGLSDKIGKQLRETILRGNVAPVIKMLQDRQVSLIKSLPIDAGLRAQKFALEAIVNSDRADEIAKEILRTGHVTESRAVLIARTEIAKANSALTQARSQLIGTSQYIWRTADDGAVRDSHQEMDGKIFDFNNPPTLSDGTKGNAGEFPNCRCFAEPIILQ